MPPLVFLPGAGGSAGFWRPVAERLADLGPAHLLGYPGFDGAPPDPGVGSLDALFAWVLARLPPGPSHVVAQSMGGVLAARLAVEHPERVARLVLAATSGGVDVARLGAADWRPEYRASLPGAPAWFVDDRTDFTERLGAIRDPGSPERRYRAAGAAFSCDPRRASRPRVNPRQWIIRGVCSSPNAHAGEPILPATSRAPRRRCGPALSMPSQAARAGRFLRDEALARGEAANAYSNTCASVGAGGRGRIRFQAPYR